MIRKIFDIIANNAVPAVFIIISAFAIPLSGYSASYLIQELLTRIGRNSFLILSLLIPIMAGMGLNFGMVLGAMAGQIGLLFICDPESLLEHQLSGWQRKLPCLLQNLFWKPIYRYLSS